MDDAVLKETRAFNAELERLLATERPVHTLPPELTRRFEREGGDGEPPPVFLDRAEDHEAKARDGSRIPMRVVRPAGEPTGVYLHIHGGGWVLGAPDLQDPLLARVADATGLVAVSVGYRLAPEQPFPAGVDDCEDAVRHVLKAAPVFGAPERFMIGGESAGAHLSVLTLIRLRDSDPDLLHLILGANLVYGVYDLSGTPSMLRWGERNMILSTPVMVWFIEQFVPGAGAEGLRSPAISPLYADLTGLPPALFTVGTMDPLLDDSLFMHARWSAAGNRAELAVWREAVHDFVFHPVRVADLANARQDEFLRSLLA